MPHDSAVDTFGVVVDCWLLALLLLMLKSCSDVFCIDGVAIAG
jgi:hypothetical protein